MSVKVRFRVESLAVNKATLKAIQDATIEDVNKATAVDAVGVLVLHFDTDEGASLFKIGNEVMVEVSQVPKLKPPKS